MTPVRHGSGLVRGPGSLKGPQSLLGNPKPGDLALGRMKCLERGMEVRRCSDVQFVTMTWGKDEKRNLDR